MAEYLGKAELNEMPRIRDRMTFLYLEHCKLTRRDGALCIWEADRGMTLVPIADMMVLLLGPGVTVTHDAMTLVCDCGMTVNWVGEQCVRFYASGRCLTNKTSLAEQQARLFANSRLRTQVARRMYGMRFEDDVSRSSIRVMRGKEGVRVRKLYKNMAEQYGIPFKRNYVLGDLLESDSVNQALSVANHCLYGVCHAAIAALGLSPYLGFVHCGNELAFVYDIADLYKHELTIPIAFEIGTSYSSDIPTVMRHRMRDEFYKQRLLKRIVEDTQYVLGIEVDDRIDASVVDLQEYKDRKAVGG